MGAVILTKHALNHQIKINTAWNLFPFQLPLQFFFLHKILEKKQVHAQSLKVTESTQIIFPHVQFVFVRIKIIVQLLELCFSKQKPLLQ